jgi:EF hand
MRKVSGLEAVYRDYGPKDVRFFFIYKSLAHPEDDAIVQPFTHEERLLHAREAKKRLGNTIPFLVDDMDNRLKHALGDRSNSEFIVDPEGTVARKHTWSDPDQVRKDLEELVGKIEKITKPEDVILKVEKAPEVAAKKGVVPRIQRVAMSAIVFEPQFEKGGVPFYAKLRAEADGRLIDEGTGKLYLGFHLDPFYGVHWNNLKKPLRFELELPEGVKFSSKAGESPAVKVDADLDPREFLLDVEAWPSDKTIRLTVLYAACTDDVCHEVRQTYLLHRQHDRDGGRATNGDRRPRFSEEMVKLLTDCDKDRDGKLSREELPAHLRPRFAEFDLNKDGFLDKDEIKKMADKLYERKNP